MTNAQFTLLCKLAGGLNEAGNAAVEAGLIRDTRSNKRDRTERLMGIETADASALIEKLGGRKLTPAAAPPARYTGNGVSEGQEVDGYMIDRGEDN